MVILARLNRQFMALDPPGFSATYAPHFSIARLNMLRVGSSLVELALSYLPPSQIAKFTASLSRIWYLPKLMWPSRLVFQLKLQVQRFKERTESALEEQATFKYRRGKPDLRLIQTCVICAASFASE